jgi:hypothetical protein
MSIPFALCLGALLQSAPLSPKSLLSAFPGSIQFLSHHCPQQPTPIPRMSQKRFWRLVCQLGRAVMFVATIAEVR